MLKRSSVEKVCFRPALPSDRRQIRFLLRTYYLKASLGDQFSLHQRSLKDVFCLGLLFSLLLHWLHTLGGFALAGAFFLGTLALTAWLNLQQVDWQHYWVIERNDRLLACGQLKCCGSWALLSDVVVAPDWRRCGVGSQLIARLAKTVPHTIYLACRPQLISFYQRFGFQVVAPQHVSLYLKQELGISNRPHLVVLQRLR